MEQINKLSNWTIGIGLLNYMIGGTILVLPVLAMKTGYINMVVICLFMGFMSYYTANLIVAHIGSSKDIKQSILAHFSQNYIYVKIYSILICVGFITTFIIYFQLIIFQISGLFGQKDFIPYIAIVSLTCLIIIVRYYNFSQQSIALGVISVISYVIFLIWVLFSSPSGQKTLAASGDWHSLTSTLIFAFSIHDCLPQNIKRAQNQKQTQKTLIFIFSSGFLLYLFIMFSGYGLINRQPYISQPQTVLDYFTTDQWPVKAIEMIYFIHLVSVYPNIVNVSIKRFYQILEIQTNEKLQWFEVVYIIIAMGIVLLIHQLQIKVQTIITFSGSILTFTALAAIPILLHFKCLFYDKNCGQILNQKSSHIQTNESQCDVTYKSKWTLYLQTFFLIFVLIFGCIVMILTIIGLFSQ